MATSSELTGQLFNDPTSYAAATHANHSAPQENDAEPTTHDTYGPGSVKPLAHYDPNTQSWKTSQDIELWEDSPSLANLPKSGMTRNGALFQQPDWVPIICVNESSLWPTPTTHGENTTTRIEAHARRLANGMKYSSRLTQAIALREPHSTGYMNPAWVEWLMGFPIGWTDCED